MDANLQQLIDQTAIRGVISKYCSGIVKKDKELVRSVYWDDAHEDHAGYYEGGPDAFVAWAFSHLEGDKAIAHVLGQSIIDVDGDSATSETWVTVHRVCEGSVGDMLAVSLGRYIDRFERRDGQWRIFQRRLIMDVQYSQNLNGNG